jgi:hypothetical protein
VVEVDMRVVEADMRVVEADMRVEGDTAVGADMKEGEEVDINNKQGEGTLIDH